jgi:hypothetical protein
MSRELLRRCLKEEERIIVVMNPVVAGAVEDGGIIHNSVIQY